MLEVKNYRPIRLTNVYCKTLERLVRSKSENLLFSCQSGFRSGLSTLTQLLNAQALIVDNINQLKCGSTVYTLTLNTITHSKLLLKLRAYGIHSHLYNWIIYFFTDRLQFVSIKSVSSILKPCTSGVAQGSIPSPIFFLLYMNDLPECVKYSSKFLCADDAKVSKPVNFRLNCLLFQQDLDGIAAWCAIWLLTLNIAKCFYIRFGLANKPLFNYTFSGIALSQVSVANDLGILFDSKLDFSHYTIRSWPKVLFV